MTVRINDRKLPKIEMVIKLFKEQEPGFIDFENPQSEQITRIRNSHRLGLVKARLLLDELSTKKLEKDEFTALLSKFLNSIPYYFDWREIMHWRDVSDQVGFQKGCTDFFKALPVRDYGTFEHYSSYFSEFGKIGFASVNYFMLFCHFVYDPDNYCAMKVTRLEKVFKLLGVETKLSGHLIDFDQFSEINSICKSLYRDLSTYHPQDMSDVGIFMHIIAEHCFS
jgi:hypothetical protein